MRLKKYFIIGLALYGLMTINLLAQSPIPNPVMKFAATSNISSNGSTIVVFNWYADPNSSVQPSSFILYSSSSNNQKFDEYSRLAEVQATQNNNGLYSYTMQLNTNSKLCFAITAAKSINGQIYQSTPTYFCDFITDKTYISFTNYPEYNGKINEDYYYYPKVITNSDKQVKFQMIYWDTKDYKFDETTGEFKWKPTAQGTYNFILKAYLADNSYQTELKWTVYVQDPNAGYVKIISTPTSYAKPGVEYKYQIQATSNIKCAIRYEFIGNLPDNASFDKENGIFKWTPKELQVISGAFKAISICDDKLYAIQQFAIKGYDNGNTDYCSVINGYAFLDNGAVITEGKAVAWRISPDSKVNPMFGGYIQGGKFEIKVPEGEYVVQFYGPEFEETWFDNATSFDKAQRFTLKCNEVYTLKVALKSISKANYYTVSGSLKNEFGDAVMGYVEFYPLISSNNSNKNNIQFAAKTDLDGNYSVSLPDNYDYKAHAVATDSKQYGDLYYNQVTSLLQADLIIVNQDVKGINFVFSEKENSLGYISGTVYDDNSNPIHSVVYATQTDVKNGKIAQFASKTDDKGNFYFENIPYGNYVLLSVPTERTYLPGYYLMGGFATTSWKEATRIGVGDFVPTVMIDIKHKIRPAVKGIIQIDGIVNKLNSIAIKGDSPQATKSPLAGAFIYIVDSDGEISDFGFSDENGNFSLKEVGQGTSTLYADAPGFEPMSYKITADYQKNYKLSGYCFDLAPTTILSVENELDNFTVYPNITNQFINISFNSINELGIFSIVDMLGNEIISTNKDLKINESNLISLDLTGIPQGNYLLKVKNGNKTSVSKIKIVK